MAASHLQTLRMAAHLGPPIVLLRDGLVSLLPRRVPATESQAIRRAGSMGLEGDPGPLQEKLGSCRVKNQEF